MHRKPLILSFALCFWLVNNTYGQTLPFIDNAKTEITSTKKIAVTDTKKGALSYYVKGSVLDLSYGSLEDKDMPGIIEFLKNHPEITSLNLEGNGELTGVGLIPLASIETILNLNLARNHKDCPNGVCIGGLEAKDVTAFANNKSLKILNLDMHSIDDDGAIALAKNTTLEKLYVSSNNIKDVGGVALAQNRTLKELSLWANDEVGLQTAEALAKNRTLRKLNLKQTSIPDQGAIALAENVILKQLNLSATDVTDIGTAALAKNQTLQRLDLCWSHIGLNGALALAANKTLVSVSLCGDFFNERPPRIGDEGAVAFGHNTTLRELELDNEDISSAGVSELVKNPALKILWLSENRKIGDEGAILIAQHSNQFIELGLPVCRLTDKGAQALASMSGPKKIFAGFNFISDVGAEALGKNTSVRELDLMINEIHDEGAVALAQNKTLSRLNVLFNRIGIIGNKALENNHYIQNIETGGENPYPPHSEMGSINQINPILPAYRSATRIGYCYRTKNSIECVKTKD